MVSFDRSKITILILILSLVVFAALIIFNAGVTYIYVMLVLLITVFFIGVIAYGLDGSQE